MQVYADYTDQLLLQAIRKDDERAFAELFSRHWKKAQVLAYSKIKSKELTEDIVQDLFITLWDKRKSLVIKNISSYIFISIKNKVLNHIESKLVHEKYWKWYKQFIPHSEKATEETVFYDTLLDAIGHGLEELPDKSRTAFCLNHLEGRSVPEIAQQLNLSEKTIQYHITRSLKHLRVYLRDFTVSILPFLLFAFFLRY